MRGGTASGGFVWSEEVSEGSRVVQEADDKAATCSNQTWGG